MVSIFDLKNHCQNELGHPVALYRYGSDEINNSLVGFVGGGGLKDHAIESLNECGVNTYVTGITMKTPYNREAHDLAEKYQINIIGATHYSTEKQAMIRLADWFEINYDLPARFITEQPDMGDIDL